mmetsp:Transcript_11786/g.21321  ORF Transcript_11786/g.21321 Transcript_11786/m.21321 type:complete len:91 (+) Transcript_11786:389-661(+)
MWSAVNEVCKVLIMYHCMLALIPWQVGLRTEYSSVRRGRISQWIQISSSVQPLFILEVAFDAFLLVVFHSLVEFQTLTYFPEPISYILLL